MAMQDIPTLEARGRDLLGKRNTRRLRKQDRLPAVIYGHKKDPAHVSVDRGRLTELLHHEAHLLEVTVDGKQEHCLVKDIQWDHLGTDILHADLARVDLTEQVQVQVDLRLVGDAVGLKESGAYLEHTASTVMVKCRAGDIPDHVTADIGGLGVGESLTIAGVTLPEGVVAVDDPELILAGIHMAKAEAESEPTDEEAAAASSEPAVIKKEKTEQDADDKK